MSFKLREFAWLNCLVTSVLSLFIVTAVLAEPFKHTPVITFLLDEEIASPVDPVDPVDYSPGAFLENDGLVVIELESLDAPQDWVEKEGDGAIESYLEWEGNNYFNSQGNGLLTAKVVISNPGTYQFLWRNSIRAGSSTTDSNDSWLKILADNFYGVRNSDGNIVCPTGQPSTNQCEGQTPKGSTGNGWFKVYRSGGTASSWSWSTRTSDSDPHLIYADFNEVGEYEVQISARSKNHAIDRLVLFRARNNNDNIVQSFATDSNRPVSLRVE